MRADLECWGCNNNVRKACTKFSIPHPLIKTIPILILHVYISEVCTLESLPLDPPYMPCLPHTCMQLASDCAVQPCRTFCSICLLILCNSVTFHQSKMYDMAYFSISTDEPIPPKGKLIKYIVCTCRQRDNHRIHIKYGYQPPSSW